MVNKRILEELGQYKPFDNVEWEIRVRGTTDHDQRIMSFVDNLWGFEVTGGVDQYEPLTVIAVRKCGLAKRCGIRINDIITMINDIDASTLTLAEAQEIIQGAGRHIKIYVKGEEPEEDDEELTTDCWFKPLTDAERALLEWEKRMRANRDPGKWNDVFPWNDRRKTIYKESNCFRVESKVEPKIRECHMRYSKTPEPGQQSSMTSTSTTTTTSTSRTELVVEGSSSSQSRTQVLASTSSS